MADQVSNMGCGLATPIR